jgi:hypothetical protein
VDVDDGRAAVAQLARAARAQPQQHFHAERDLLVVRVVLREPPLSRALDDLLEHERAPDVGVLGFRRVGSRRVGFRRVALLRRRLRLFEDRRQLLARVRRVRGGGVRRHVGHLGHGRAPA